MSGLEMKYFVLNPAKAGAFGSASRAALRAYATAIEPENAALANDLFSWASRTDPERAHAIPAIGEVWPGHGGIYAGIVRGDPGQPDYHLIVATEDFGECKWQAAMDRAKGILGGDYTLPKRKEQAVLFGNVPELFEKASYWSCEPYASDAGYAWYQYFYDGSQYDFPKGDELRARAVRRLPI